MSLVSYPAGTVLRDNSTGETVTVGTSGKYNPDKFTVVTMGTGDTTSTAPPATSSSSSPAPSSAPASTSATMLTRVQRSMVDEQGRPVYDVNTGQKINYGGVTSTNPTSTQIQPTGNAQLDALLQQLSSVIDKNVAAGNTVNPNLNITPELAAKFISDARTVVDPYTQQIIDQHIADINATLGTLASSLRNSQEGAIAQFNSNLGSERENASGRGIVFSGTRGKTEQNMVDAQNRSLQALENAYAGQIGSVLRGGAEQLGSGVEGLRGSSASFNLPNVARMSVGLQGPEGSAVRGGNLSYGYDPSLYKTGAVTRDYQSNLAGQANQFMSNYLNSSANNGARSFQPGANGTLTLQ